MSWNATKKYPVNIDGGRVELSEEKIGELIKKKLKASRVVNCVFEDFSLSIDRLDDLQVTIKALDGKVAETDDKEMSLAPEIIEDILSTNFYIPVHEICGHYTSRQTEKIYMNDPEEAFGMVAAAAIMFEENFDLDVIWQNLWSKIGYHFHNESDAREVMKKIIERGFEMAKKAE